MQSFSLSPQEAAFVSQYEATVDDIAIDLTDLHRQINYRPYSSLRSNADAIISRIRGLVNYTRDIEFDLHELMHQMFDLRHHGLPALTVDFEGEPVPVIFNTAERSRYNGTLSSFVHAPGPTYSIVDTDQAIRSIGAPLTKFLASRATQSAGSPVQPTVPNVTVSNKANGWQIVFSPYYVSSENGFGGPSTPVSGFLNPGRYRFGIKQSPPPQWDTNSWNIPSQNNPYIPLP